jgi:hypothetical protein
MRVVALLLATALAGCAEVPMAPAELDRDAKMFRPTDGLSTIYLFRDENLGASARITISLDDQVAGQTAAWTYLRWVVSPGTHHIASYADNVDVLTLATEPDGMYFVRQDIKLGVPYPRAQLRLVDEQRGRAGVRASRRAADQLATGE